METRTLGRTGLEITRLGIGLAEIARHERAGKKVEDAKHVVNLDLDSSINFLDTGAC